MDFAVHAAALSAEADVRLGDLLSYAIDGQNGGSYVAMKGRITAAEPASGWQQGDEIRGTWRLRIAKALVPRPTIRDRIQCETILGAGRVYRPVSSNPIDDGRYWLVDLQKV